MAPEPCVASSHQPMSGRSYEERLRELEERHRPQPRSILPYLFRSSRWGLKKAAKAAEDHADDLDRLEPPSHVLSTHREYVAALRASARDTRQLVAQGGWLSGRALVSDLRALSSFRQMVEARHRLLDHPSEE